MAKQAFSTHRILLKSGLNLHMKKRIVKTMVWSVLLYGSELDLDPEDSRCQKTGKFGNVGVETDGEDKLD